MVVVKVTVRSGGLHPLEACRAWHLVEEEGYSLPEAAKEVRTVDGEEPKEHALRNAISRVSTQIDDDVPGKTRYANSGRKRSSRRSSSGRRLSSCRSGGTSASAPAGTSSKS